MSKFGDIRPNVSGRSHIGVDGGTVVGSFDATSISPFGHIIGLSGVFVDPILGQSGVIRYTRATPGFEVSVDGGLSFQPLPLDDHTLQNAYDGNRIIQIEGRKSGPLGIEQGGEPVIIRMPPGHSDGTDTFGGGHQSTKWAGLVVSGVSAIDEQDNFRRSSIASLTSYRLAIKASGSENVDPSKFNLRAIDSDVFWTVAAENFQFGLGSGCQMQTLGGDLKIRSRPNGVGTLGGQLSLGAFHNGTNASGALEYRFGSYEAWYWRPSHEVGGMGGPFADGYHPIPHSGQVEEMIRKSIDPFTSGIHSLGAPDIEFTATPPLPLTWTPYGIVAQNSGMFFSPIHGVAGGFRFNPTNSGMEVTNGLAEPGQGWHPVGQSITRTWTIPGRLPWSSSLDDDAFAIEDPLVIGTTDTQTIAGQLFSNGFSTRKLVQFTIPDWVDRNYPITARWYGLIGNTSPSGAGQQIELETILAWNNDNDNYLTGPSSNSSTTIFDISGYSLLDYFVADLGVVIPAKVLSEKTLVHGVIERDARITNLLDDDYPDLISLLDMEFTARVKRGYAGEFE